VVDKEGQFHDGLAYLFMTVLKRRCKVASRIGHRGSRSASEASGAASGSGSVSGTLISASKLAGAKAEFGGVIASGKIGAAPMSLGGAKHPEGPRTAIQVGTGSPARWAGPRSYFRARGGPGIRDPGLGVRPAAPSVGRPGMREGATARHGWVLGPEIPHRFA